MFTAIESVNKANGAMPVGVVSMSKLTVFQQGGSGSMNAIVRAASFYQAETLRASIKQL